MEKKSKGVFEANAEHSAKKGKKGKKRVSHYDSLSSTTKQNIFVGSYSKRASRKINEINIYGTREF